MCDLDPEPTHHCVSGRLERGPLERIDFSIKVRFEHYRGLRRERVKAQHALLFRHHSVCLPLGYCVPSPPRSSEASPGASAVVPLCS